MTNRVKIFFWGIGISFVGTLPLGTLNVTAMQIALSQSVSAALWFALGCIMVEMAALALTLLSANWLLQKKMLMKALEWFSLLIMLLLACYSFIAAAKDVHNSSPVYQYHLPKIILGMMLSAVNPAQFPFWFGWNSILLQKKILIPSKAGFAIYIWGAATGTLLGFLLFILLGNWLSAKLVSSQRLINTAVGMVFTVTAFAQAYKMWHSQKRRN
jgi:threonine/homoserine/homoserine lactone efflux protein